MTGDILNQRLVEPVIHVELVHKDAKLPVQAQKWDAGFDLSTVQGATMAPGDRVILDTGIALAIPNGFVGFIKPRSGLAAKHGIDVLAGVIDSGYRGEVRVVLLNTGRLPLTIDKGDRIAQLVVQRVASPEFQVVESVDLSERGANGFGSTGVQ